MVRRVPKPACVSASCWKAKTEPAAKRAKAERVVLHGSDQEVRQLLRACDCYDEFLHDLKTDPTYAAAVLKCVTSANKDKLCADNTKRQGVLDKLRTGSGLSAEEPLVGHAVHPA